MLSPKMIAFLTGLLAFSCFSQESNAQVPTINVTINGGVRPGAGGANLTISIQNADPNAIINAQVVVRNITMGTTAGPAGAFVTTDGGGNVSFTQAFTAPMGRQGNIASATGNITVNNVIYKGTGNGTYVVIPQ